MTTSQSTSTPSQTGSSVTRVLIVVEGIVTVLLCLVAFPIGAALVVANAAMAIVTRGTNRKLFAVFAIAGAVVCIAVALILPGVSSSGELGPVVRL